ncbi:MAG: hypothetical protein JXA42_19150 [Anaerolineales bacterium]|nr:hypothetical protein [Anaerolineales bacterium]
MGGLTRVKTAAKAYATILVLTPNDPLELLITKPPAGVREAPWRMLAWEISTKTSAQSSFDRIDLVQDPGAASKIADP